MRNWRSWRLVDWWIGGLGCWILDVGYWILNIGYWMRKNLPPHASREGAGGVEKNRRVTV